MQPQHTLIKNAHIITPDKEIPCAHIEIQNGTIKKIHQPGQPLPNCPTTHDAQHNLTLPGFIDIHTHGANGHDLTDAQPHTLPAIAHAKLQQGVTTFLPTTLTLPPQKLIQTLQAAQPYQQNPTHAKTPAIHIEGPYINPSCAGAQNPNHTRPPNIHEILTLNQIYPIKICSYAPELPGAIPFTRQLTQHHIIPSIAHTNATYQQIQQAHKAGARHLTHYTNQMTPLHHRQIGCIGAPILNQNLHIELIPDGIHLCPEMIQIAFQTIGPKRIMLITDSTAAAGLPDNTTTHLGDLQITTKNGAARLPDGTLAGSTLPMNQALKNTHQYTQIPLPQLIRTTSLNQAQTLNLPNLGKIQPGYTADITILDHNWQPQTTYTNGTPHHHTQQNQT